MFLVWSLPEVPVAAISLPPPRGVLSLLVWECVVHVYQLLKYDHKHKMNLHGIPNMGLQGFDRTKLLEMLSKNEVICAWTRSSALETVYFLKILKINSPKCEHWPSLYVIDANACVG